MGKKSFTTADIANAAFDAVSSGKITMTEYKTIVSAVKVIKKLF